MSSNYNNILDLSNNIEKSNDILIINIKTILNNLLNRTNTIITQDNILTIFNMYIKDFPYRIETETFNYITETKKK